MSAQLEAACRALPEYLGEHVVLSAAASTSRVTKKCGTVVQLWVVRSAMIRPIELTASGGPDGTATEPDEGAAGPEVISP